MSRFDDWTKDNVMVHEPTEKDRKAVAEYERAKQEIARQRRAEQGWDSQVLDIDVERQLERALVEFRQQNAGPRPDYVKTGDQRGLEHISRGLTDEERTFSLGYQKAALMFWNELLHARERLRSAQKGSRNALRDRVSTDSDETITRAAKAYRRCHPYDRGGHSTTKMAEHIAHTLRLPAPTEREPNRLKTGKAVRHILKRLGIR